MTQWTESLAKRIKRNEGKSLKPYTDQVGKITIGYGRNLTDVGITNKEADILFDSDLDKAFSQVQSKLSDLYRDLDQPRLGVLVEMTFNMGIYNVLKFKKMLKAIRSKDWEQASIEMLNSKWYTQVGTRALQLSKIMRTGKE